VEYEARSIKWYWVALLILYSGGAIYLLLKSNPYLYSQKTLKSQFQKSESNHIAPWPPKSSQFELNASKLGEPAPWPYLTSENTNITSEEVTRNKSYTEFKAYDLQAIFKGSAKPFLQTKSSLFVTDETGRIFLFDSKGNLKWSYHPHSNDGFFQSLVDNELLYLIQKNGEVTALQLDSGRPQWILPLETEVAGEAWTYKDHLLVPLQADKASSKTSSEIAVLSRESGVLEKTLPGFDFKDNFKKVRSSDGWLLYSGSQVIAISHNYLESQKTLWSTTLPEQIADTMAVYNGQAFLHTVGNRLYVLNLKKKGDVDLDMDLDVTPGGGFTYLPEMDRLAYLSKDSILRVLDLKKGEKAWRFDLGVGGSLREIWSSRLKGAYIQEFGMKWAYKGWTIWSPCRKHHFCIYNPEKGQLIQRIEMSGEPLHLPMIAENQMLVVIRKPDGKLALSLLLEPAEYKAAMAKEEAQNSTPAN
tara:strand:- start:335 stop:1753 length:1419 start_codon:yes stop_codon:yes gene_type:complete